MLVISRKKNESIVIGDRIVITIVEIRGDKVRLGVEAPRQCPVHRREILEAIRGDRWYAPPEPSCPQEEEFLKAIDAAPRDRDLLLVYADWLEERGDSRSEEIRRSVRWRL